MKRFKAFCLACGVLLCLSPACVLIPQPPKPTWDQQVGGLLNDIFANVQQIIEASK